MRTTLEMPIQKLIDSFEIDETCPSGLRRKIMPREYFKSNVAWGYANAMYGDKPAGSLKLASGGVWRWMVRFADKDWQVSRIIWAIANRVDPKDNYVDHIDGNPENNRLANLRLVNTSQSHANRKAKSCNPSGCPGVHKYRDGWIARLRVQGKEIKLGFFTALEEAIQARRLGEAEHYGEFGFFASRGL